MKIQILIDSEKSWYNDYVDELSSEIKKLAHDVILIKTKEDIKQGDILFLLSCVKLLPEKYRKLNKHNIVIHAADVPRGRGWSPTTWQILEGKNIIPISVFEAEEEVDSGVVYLKDKIILDGTELIDEWREKLSKKVNELALRFVKSYSNIKSSEQIGESTFYEKRTPDDSELDINKTIKNQFNLFRVVDNERYPAFFKYKGNKYIIKISKEKK